MSVLGAHFLEVAAEWQGFMINQVAPMAECDPAMVRSLSALSSYVMLSTLLDHFNVCVPLPTFAQLSAACSIQGMTPGLHAKPHNLCGCQSCVCLVTEPPICVVGCAGQPLGAAMLLVLVLAVVYVLTARGWTAVI